jgi:hypothetical protein
MKIIKLASMDMGIDGYTPPREMNHILDATFFFRDKLFYDVLNEQERRRYSETGNGPHMLDIDGGSDYSSKEGTINFYSYQFPQKTKAIQAIKYFAQEINAEIISVTGPEREGQKNEVYRVNIIMYPQQPKDEPPRINMANGNARDIFSGLLNFSDGGDWGYSMDAWQLVTRIDKIVEAQIEEHTREPSITKEEGKATFIGVGTTNEYLKRRLKEIRAFAQWAIDHGYTKIYVG